MRLVVDASVALKWLVDEEGADVADRILGHATELHAPRLLASEVTNALWRKARIREIERSDVGVLVAAVAHMPLAWTEDERICAGAGRLAVGLERPVYDCMYLALAHRLGVRLVTADTRFANALAATEHGSAVITLSALEDEFEAGAAPAGQP
jgi:predicted nucleic acid-binding protein